MATNAEYLRDVTRQTASLLPADFFTCAARFLAGVVAVAVAGLSSSDLG